MSAAHQIPGWAPLGTLGETLRGRWPRALPVCCTRPSRARTRPGLATTERDRPLLESVASVLVGPKANGQTFDAWAQACSRAAPRAAAVILGLARDGWTAEALRATYATDPAAYRVLIRAAAG